MTAVAGLGRRLAPTGAAGRRRERRRRAAPASGCAVPGRLRLRSAPAAGCAPACFSISGLAKKYSQPTTTIERQHDGEDGVLVLVHSTLAHWRCCSRDSGGRCSARRGMAGEPASCRARAAGRHQFLPAAELNSAERRIEFPHHFAERQFQRRAPPDQYIIVAGVQFVGPVHPRPRAALTISRKRRRTRLRSTALPTCRDTVKPTRTAPSSPRAAPANERARRSPACRAAAARKSAPALQPLHGELNGTGASVTH